MPVITRIHQRLQALQKFGDYLRQNGRLLFLDRPLQALEIAGAEVVAVNAATGAGKGTELASFVAEVMTETISGKIIAIDLDASLITAHSADAARGCDVEDEASGSTRCWRSPTTARTEPAKHSRCI